jgi:hypothetical protein
MDEDFDQYETISLQGLGYLTWSFGLITGLLSFVAQYMGLVTFRSSDGFSWVWWTGGSFLLFSWSTIFWALAIAMYFRKMSQERNKALSNLVALLSLLTALLWIAMYAILIQPKSDAIIIQLHMSLGLGGAALGVLDLDSHHYLCSRLVTFHQLL